MSSVFLYLGIVAIWAFWLVPRWLRGSHHRPQAGPGFGTVEGIIEEEHFGYAYTETVEYEAEYEEEEFEDDPPVNQQRAHVHPQLSASRPSHPSSKVLQARRRLLTMLVLLTAIAGTCVALKLTSWWVCLPPAGLLGLYVLLLREAAVADAEQARLRAAQRADAAWQRARLAAEAEVAAQQSAEIIDISGRVTDQLYDQYADATIRAVGD